MVFNKAVFRKYGDKLLFALALAVLAAALARPEGKKAIAQVTAPVIVFTHWWEGDLEKGTLQNLVDEFENLHGEIKIVLKNTGYGDLRRQLFSPDGTGGEEGIPGDVVALDPLWVPELAGNGIVEDTVTQILSFINVLFYNVDMLKEAGFVRPPKSRGEFLAYAGAVTDAGKNRWGLTGSGSVHEDIYPWIWAAGVQFLKDGEPAVDSRAVAESLSFLASLDSGNLTVPGALLSGSAGAGGKPGDFVSGRAAFMIAPSNHIRHIRERMGDVAFGVSSVPVPDNYAGKSFSGTAGWTAGIHTASAHKEEAKLFAAFLAEKAPLLSEKAMAISGNAAVPPGPGPFYSKVWDIAVANESAQEFSGTAGDYGLEEIFREELAVLFAGKTGPAEAAAAIQERWTAKLKAAAE